MIYFSPVFGIAQMRFARRNLNSVFRMPAEQHFKWIHISYNEQTAISNFSFWPPVLHPSLLCDLYPTSLEPVLLELIWKMNRLHISGRLKGKEVNNLRNGSTENNVVFIAPKIYT